MIQPPQRPVRAQRSPTSSRCGRRIALVGCVKEKASRELPAEDLYTSTLFRRRRQYVESSCDEWWILSAEHGLVHPRTELAPYDVTLKNASRAERRSWSSGVIKSIQQMIRTEPGDTFEIHAGAEYRDFGLVAGLTALGCAVEIPTQGMAIGHQLAFYKNFAGRE